MFLVTRRIHMTTKKESTTKPTARARSATKPSTAMPKQARKPGALDAAVKLLVEAKAPMTTRKMIDATEAKNLGKSPGGKTPDRTLDSAILREIVLNGKRARFAKAEREKFMLKKGL